ncbi:glycosyltransferase family 1 protein [Candidatus Microgenomates bacterium]|nr:MAG: glycosyltransferase family 1 protein [Candidatus Microgenomates bacterium]
MKIKKNILLVYHHSGTPGGPAARFNNYLRERHNIFIVQHPLWANKNLFSIIKSQDREKRFKIKHFQFFLESLFTLHYLPKMTKYNQIDLAICFDPLSFFHTYILKHFLKIKKIVYYNIDYSRTRFGNKFLNRIYRTINIFAYKRCDYFFSLTKKFIEDTDPEEKFDYKNYFVKNLVDTKGINLKANKIKNSIVYAGSINWNMDFNSLFIALKKLKDENINFILDIYGGEKPDNNFLKTIKRLNLQKNIFLRGAVDNKELTEKILPKYNIGVSPYMTKNNPLAHDHMLWGNDLSAKLVEYLAAGLPTITTKNDFFSSIEKNKLGFLVENSEEWYKNLKKLLKNKTLYKKYQNNALKYSKNYDQEKILNPIFKKILN